MHKCYLNRWELKWTQTALESRASMASNALNQNVTVEVGAFESDSQYSGQFYRLSSVSDAVAKFTLLRGVFPPALCHFKLHFVAFFLQYEMHFSEFLRFKWESTCNAMYDGICNAARLRASCWRDRVKMRRIVIAPDSSLIAAARIWSHALSKVELVFRVLVRFGLCHKSWHI